LVRKKVVFDQFKKKFFLGSDSCETLSFKDLVLLEAFKGEESPNELVAQRDLRGFRKLEIS